MKFCSSCGALITHKIPDGDNRLRYVCESCGEIHYQNPKVIAGILPTYKSKVLLCKRSIQPRVGYWTLPAGFLENGESSLEGAIRECSEEANTQVRDPLYMRFLIFLRLIKSISSIAPRCLKLFLVQVRNPRM